MIRYTSLNDKQAKDPAILALMRDLCEVFGDAKTLKTMKDLIERGGTPRIMTANLEDNYVDVSGLALFIQKRLDAANAGHNEKVVDLESKLAAAERSYEVMGDQYDAASKIASERLVRLASQANYVESLKGRIRQLEVERDRLQRAS